MIFYIKWFVLKHQGVWCEFMGWFLLPAKLELYCFTISDNKGNEHDIKYSLAYSGVHRIQLNKIIAQTKFKLSDKALLNPVHINCAGCCARVAGLWPNKIMNVLDFLHVK